MGSCIKEQEVGTPIVGTEEMCKRTRTNYVEKKVLPGKLPPFYCDPTLKKMHFDCDPSEAKLPYGVIVKDTQFQITVPVSRQNSIFLLLVGPDNST